MAFKYQWLTGSSGGGVYVSGSAMPGIVLTVPAGGRMVKWIYNCYYAGWVSTAAGAGGVTPLQHGWAITINSTQYVNREIYWTRRLVPWFSVVNTTGNVNAVQIQTYHGGGDLELGAEGECSYGGPGKGAITVTHGGNIAGIRTGAELVSGVVNRRLRVLYEI